MPWGVISVKGNGELDPDVCSDVNAGGDADADADDDLLYLIVPLMGSIPRRPFTMSKS